MYTIQAHKTSGDIHALVYDGNDIVGISESLHYRDVEKLEAHNLRDLDYGPYEGNPDGTDNDGFVEWFYPTLTSTV
jgi:hypothetical protein